MRNSYDAAGRLTKIEKGALSAWQSEAVAPANWTGFTVFQTVDTQYDSMDRKTRETVSGVPSPGTNLPAGIQTLTEYSYDALGRLKCAAVRMNPAEFATPTDACTQDMGTGSAPDRIVMNSYDAAGQLLKVTEGIGTSIVADEVTNSYTLNGKLQTLTDAENNRTTFEYDGHDRLTKTRFPVPSKGALASSDTDNEQWSYDPNGNVVSKRLRDGQVIGFTYDALNRATLKDLPAPESDVSYSHDLRGLQTAATFVSSGETVTNTYDGFGRMSSTTSTMGGTARTITSQYDAGGNRTRITHPDGMYFTYDHDGVNRVKDIRENGSALLASFGYDQIGRRTSLTRGNGTSSTYSYDGASRLAQLDTGFAGNVARSVADVQL